MSKLYMIRKDCEETWKEKLSPEVYARFTEQGFDIDDVVELSKNWDMALQLVLDQTRVIRDDA